MPDRKVRNDTQLSMMLRKYITKRGFTMSQLSRVVGVPSKTLNDWCNNKYPSSLGVLVKISNRLGVTTDDLLKGDGMDLYKGVK